MPRNFKMLLLIISVIFVSNNAVAANEKYGYAWANESQTRDYVPNKEYSYNSSGKAIKINRIKTGQYSVKFVGLGGGNHPGGHVQVTAYGNTTDHCKILNWNSSGQDFTVNVLCFKPNGTASDSQYTVNVEWPQNKVAQNQNSANIGVQRRILKSGHVQLTFSNGTIEERYSGGKKITHPGRNPIVTHLTQAPSAIPPLAPDDDNDDKWLSYHSENLLNIIKTLVNNDQAEISNYLTFEGNNLSTYKQIEKRSEVITYLVTP